MPVAGLGPDLDQLGLGEAAARDRHVAAWSMPSLCRGAAEGAEEGVGGIADQRVEDEARAAVEDLAMMASRSVSPTGT